MTGGPRRSEGLSALVRSLFNFVARRPGAVLFTALAIVFAGAAWGAVGVLNRYFEALDANRKWIDDVRIDPQDRMLRVIFERAVEQGLIWAEIGSDGAHVRAVSCENRREGLGPEGVGPRGDVAQQHKPVLSLLCTTEHGAQVREEIRQWNDSEYLIAIRDDRNKVLGAGASRKPIVCQEAPRRTSRQPAPKMETRTAFATIPRRCLVNRWTMALVAGDRDSRPIPLEALALEPAATEFDFIASDGPRFMSDWASVTPIANVGSTREDLKYVLRSEIVVPADGLVRIDLVGRLNRVVAGGATVNVGTTPPTGTRPASARGRDGIEVAVRVRCDRKYAPSRDCTRVPGGAAPVPFANIIEIRGRARQTVTVEIEAQLERNLPRAMLKSLPDPEPEKTANADPEDEDNDDESDTEGPTKSDLGARTPNLIVACPQQAQDGATTPCDISWRPLPEPEEDEPEGDEPAKDNGEQKKPDKAPDTAKGYRVVLAGDPTRNLVEPASGEFTVDAFDRGLGPVVGAGPTQFGSLTRALRGSPDPSVTLTIDPVAQRIVRDVLEERRRRCGGGGGGDCVFTHRGVRASIVLIDASDDHAGEIRAMVAWPPGDVGSHVWDLAAGGGGAWRSTATSRQAWSVGFDGYSQPGSTFKPVTALAAIEASLDPENPARADLGRLLRGEMNLADQARYLGFRTRVRVSQDQRGRDCRAESGADASAANVLFVPRRGGGSFACLQNFGDAPNSSYFMATAVSHCPGAGRGGTQMGLCEALIKSSNMFFGGVSLLLDGPKIFTAGSGEHPPAANTLALARMANRLVPPQGDGNQYNDLMRGALPRRASLLFYDPRPVTIENSRPDPISPTAPKPDRRVSAALTGYGQNVYSAPVAMASIYASIATNRVVRPRLVPLEKLPPNRPRDPFEGAPLLEKGTPQERASYLAILRAGLHGVVSARGGSAASYFKGAQSLTQNGNEWRLFGKTGTATITKRYNTVWFSGWIEGNQGSGITKRLAFVCQAIQQPAGQKMTGGRVCAPLIRDILLKLDQKRS